MHKEMRNIQNIQNNIHNFQNVQGIMLERFGIFTKWAKNVSAYKNEKLK